MFKWLMFWKKKPSPSPAWPDGRQSTGDDKVAPYANWVPREVAILSVYVVPSKITYNFHQEPITEFDRGWND